MGFSVSSSLRKMAEVVLCLAAQRSSALTVLRISGATMISTVFLKARLNAPSATLCSEFGT